VCAQINVGLVQVDFGKLKQTSATFVLFLLGHMHRRGNSTFHFDFEHRGTRTLYILSKYRQHGTLRYASMTAVFRKDRGSGSESMDTVPFRVLEPVRIASYAG